MNIWRFTWNLKFKIGITQTLLKLLGVPGSVPQTKHYLTDARDPLFCRARLSTTHRGTGRADVGFLRSPEIEEVWPPAISDRWGRRRPRGSSGKALGRRGASIGVRSAVRGGRWAADHVRGGSMGGHCRRRRGRSVPLRWNSGWRFHQAHNNKTNPETLDIDRIYQRMHGHGEIGLELLGGNGGRARRQGPFRCDELSRALIL
jgi:hypothetical protein